ncbi:hypothetical protein GCM10011374_38250 [Kocuria dechangensis]|uniref:Alternate-type signal peptide domain-containing protein n=1 Tax=Kocuria dechangensis TaxID=1176249 RepID=A0A917M0S9_9MICC|nr:alternate-type signal peptide domain-containing protein [Kocuria dechangensis]GGG70056.1 hypothetical protein GCM10011374_38250 [Kocuria dechangensis]
MNKLTKGSLATGAGLVLLLGGTGTFMSWNDSGTADGGQVTAGHLTVDETAAGTWTSNLGPVTDIATHEIVPGETLTYTAELGVDAVGENLQVTAGLTGDSVVAVNTEDPADVALAAAVVDTAALTVDSPLFTETGVGTGVYDLTADGTGTVTVAATIAFPDTAANDTQDGQVDLTAMTVTLNQALNPA